MPHPKPSLHEAYTAAAEIHDSLLHLTTAIQAARRCPPPQAAYSISLYARACDIVRTAQSTLEAAALLAFDALKEA